VIWTSPRITPTIVRIVRRGFGFGQDIINYTEIIQQSL